jgi:hypothetical protein
VKLVEGVVEAYVETTLGMLLEEEIEKVVEVDGSGGVGVTSHSNDTQYCLLLASLNQTSQEVTHLGTTPAKARLTAEF